MYCVTCEIEVEPDNGALDWVDLTLVGAHMLQAAGRDGINCVQACSNFFKLIHLLGFHLSKFFK